MKLLIERVSSCLYFGGKHSLRLGHLPSQEGHPEAEVYEQGYQEYSARVSPAIKDPSDDGGGHPDYRAEGIGDA